VGGLRHQVGAHVDVEHVRLGPAHIDPDREQQIAHDLDVGDARHVAQHETALSHEAGSHELEGRVLRPFDPHRSFEGPARAHDDPLHPVSIVGNMARVVRRFEVDAVELEQLLAPRAQPVLERKVGEGRFEAADGPVTEYRRTVAVEDGNRVTQTVEFRLAIPYFAWFFVVPIGLSLRRPPWKGDAWWLPPERLDARASSTLATLAALGVVFGYL